jgi:phosphoribosylaminoimidazolecarboxamide formyltransferase/IMP cyclohydrolase
VSINVLSDLPQTPLKIKRALLSVSDKDNLLPLARTLHEHNVEIISTGGTAKIIAEEGIPVKDVSEITQFDECLDGRVKTLHPKVHAGILARTSYKPDVVEIENLNIQPFELVVVNLYPFKKTVSKPNTTLAEAVEYIDIGGPTMVRAAAKNFAHVCILTTPSQYQGFIDELKGKEQISYETRKELARAAFNHTADYDAAIANYFNTIFEESTPPQLNISLPKSQELRYGENPHQAASVYGHQKDYIDCFHGKQLSYNNYADIDSALNLISDFEDAGPTCAIFKHTVPSGVACADNLENAYRKAFKTDTSSPFGGIVIVNKKLDLKTARAIDEIFTEIIIAPEYDDDALKLLKKKANRRLIKQIGSIKSDNKGTFRSIFGGALFQEANHRSISLDELKVVSTRKPTDQELKDLLFAWKIVKHVKSNAIIYVKDNMTLGIGSGQTSRIDSSEIAIAKASKFNLELDNSVIASDAFFPFADGVEAAAKAGATAVIQPGGSIRDEEVIEMADKHNMAMLFTGIRHFKH